MEYFTADSYKNYERVGEPFRDENGKLKVHIQYPCQRCGGTGIIVARVENGRLIPIPVAGGICFACGGAKYIRKDVRLYTEKEKNQLDKSVAALSRRIEEAREAKKADAIAHSEENKKAWFKKNGFNDEGFTFIPTVDTFDIKDQLKADGFKFDTVLNWHSPEPKDYPCVKVAFEQVFEWQAVNKHAAYKTGAPDIVKALRFPKDTSKESNFVGEIKERLRDLEVIVKSKITYESRFGSGVGLILKFEDAKGNIFVWFTSTNQDIEVNDSILLTGTVKEHSNYGDEKQTVLSRCKISKKVA